jgi:hypothetical protein
MCGPSIWSVEWPANDILLCCQMCIVYFMRIASQHGSLNYIFIIWGGCAANIITQATREIFVILCALPSFLFLTFCIPVSVQPSL